MQQPWLTLAGWRRNLSAFALGICATLTLAPYFFAPLAIVAFSGLFLFVSHAPTPKRAFLDGWWWGWGYYVTGLYWFCIALLTDADKFAWLLPFALFGVTAVIALYNGLICWLAAKLRVRGVSGIFLFAALWTAIEFARGHLLSGFPWNLAGYAFAFSDISLQAASLAGVYGLTWLAVLLGAMPALLLEPGDRKKSWCALIAVYGFWSVLLIWGALRLQAPERYVDGVMLRLVQANSAQQYEWNANAQRQGLEERLRLTHAPGLERITHIIWPESAIPYAVSAGSPLVQMLGRATPPGALLISGALRVEGAQTQDWRIWNSIVAIDHAGAIAGIYDKSKLVPFGEFLPFRSILPKAWTTPVGDKDFSSGTGPKTVNWPGLPALSPLVCYEAIFPELAVDHAQRPHLLLNVTNDAWFGMSNGPYQHFQMARTRAVEQGIPLVRVANTGITAMIDGRGHIIDSLPLGTQGILDEKLPEPLAQPTVYALYGDRVPAGILVFSLLILILIRKKTLNY